MTHLIAQAKAEGVELVGPNGLLNRLAANVLETALGAEMDEYFGYEKRQVAGRHRPLKSPRVTKSSRLSTPASST